MVFKENAILQCNVVIIISKMQVTHLKRTSIWLLIFLKVISVNETLEFNSHFKIICRFMSQLWWELLCNTWDSLGRNINRNSYLHINDYQGQQDIFFLNARWKALKRLRHSDTWNEIETALTGLVGIYGWHFGKQSLHWYCTSLLALPTVTLSHNPHFAQTKKTIWQQTIQKIVCHMSRAAGTSRQRSHWSGTNRSQSSLLTDVQVKQIVFVYYLHKGI